MNRIERYLASVVAVHTLLVLMVLLALIGFSEFLNEVSDVNEQYTLNHASLYVLLKLPNYSYQLFPVALLIGTLMGLGALANHAELTVLRVTGWSISRIFWAIAKAAFLFWGLFALWGETVGPTAESYAYKIQSEAQNKPFAMGAKSGFWVKNDNRVVQIGQALSNRDLRHVFVYQLEQGQLSHIAYFNRVRYVNQQWLGDQQITRTLRWQQGPQVDDLASANSPVPIQIQGPSLNWLAIEDETKSQQSIDLPFMPEDLDNLTLKSSSLNVFQLQEQIAFLQENGGDVGPLQMALWKKFASPLVVLAMIAIVFPLIFGSQRQVSTGQRVFIGVLIGLMFHLGNQLVGNLSVVYQFPVVIAAFLPAGVLLVIAMVWLRWQK